LALRHHLRETKAATDLSRWLAPEIVDEVSARRNVPNALLDRMSGSLAALLRCGVISDRLVQILEDRVSTLSGILAACERIKATPLPYAYTLLLHRTCYAFCILLPFGLMESAGLATPLFAAVLSYTFFGLDILGEELERPFGEDDNALPLDAICRVIEISVLETTKLGPVPEPLGPTDFVLL
jgi:ion channel-forming bestrophin family protein